MSPLSPRWRKLQGDFRVARGRFIGIGVAMALTIAIVAAVLVARVILNREMNRNYLDTVPASAILSMDGIDEALLEAVRARPGIVAADRTAYISGKTLLPSGEQMPVVLRVVSDYSALHVAKFYPQAGAWPPPTGEVLIERAVSRMTPINFGEGFVVELPDGTQHSLRVAGTAHDPGNAPSWQERTIYGYIAAETLTQLDSDHQLDQLLIVTEERTKRTIESASRRLALWLREHGHVVQFIRIPPPGAHPHQWQIDSVALVLLGFGLLAVVLEAALLSIVIGGLLAPQVRQIAVMKAIGARTSQIAGMYSTLVVVLALAALSVGLPIGVLAGHWFADFIADLLNFNIGNDSVPPSLFVSCVALGLIVSLCSALAPIVSAARKSVRESIDYYGVTSIAADHWLTRLCNRVRVGNVSVQLAVRNLTRRKAQLVMALSLLVLTGATFMAAGNLVRLWQTITAQSIAEQRFDIQVVLRRPESEGDVSAAIASVAGVRVVEPARMQWANIDAGDQLSISTRSVPLHAVVPGSELQRLDVVTGRWLGADDQDAVVLNSAAQARIFPGVKVGDSISLLVNGKPLQLKLVGIARAMFSSEEAFTTSSAFERVVDSKGLVRAMRVGIQEGADPDAVADAIEAVLTTRDILVRNVYAKSSNSASISAHTYMLIAMLLLIVTSVGKIAIAGLASCMSTAVIERTREFGVMRTLGARTYDIQNSIILEAILIGVMSWVVAILVSLPLTLWIGKLLSAAFDRQMPVVFSPLVAVLWLVGVALVATIASVAPARRAANLTVRQTLEHT